MLKKYHVRLPVLIYLTVAGLLIIFVVSMNPVVLTAESVDSNRDLPGQIKSLQAESTGPRAANEAQYIGLQQAMDIAKTANLDVLLSKERIREALGLSETARAAFLPEFNGLVSETRLQRNSDAIGLSDELSISVPDVIGPYNLFDARFSAKIPLIDISAIQDWRAAKANNRLSEYELISVREEAMALVASFYLDALRNQESLKNAETAFIRDKRLLRLARDKKNSGTGTDLDLMRAEAQLSGTQGKVETAKMNLANSLFNLTNALGIDITEQVTLNDELSLIPVKTVDFEVALALAFKRRPDLIEQQQRELVALRKKAAAVAELLPVVEAFGDYGENGKEFDETTNVWTAKVGMTLPIWDSFKRCGDIKQYKSKLAQEKNRTLDLKRAIETGVRISANNLESAQKQVEIARENLKLLQEEFNLVSNKYESGTGTNTDVIKAEAQVSEAEFQVVKTLYDYNINRVDWFKTLGKIYEATTE